MKTFSVILAFLFFVSSCSTYRKFDLKNDEIKLGKTYKIKSGSTKFQKVKIIEYDDKDLTVLSGGKITRFKLAEIEEIEARKFSALKTVTVHVVGAVGILVVAFASWSGPSFSFN